MDTRGFGGGGILDPDDAVAEMTAWKSRIDRLAADAQQMSDQLEQLRVTVGDPDGLVQVTVDSAGSLVDLKLSRQSQQIGPDTLARTIMETVRAAKAKTAQRAQELLVETVGTDLPAARGMVDRVSAQLLRTDPPSSDDPHTPEGWAGHDGYGRR